MSIKETFSAGQTREFYGKGDFFRLLETTAEITVEFFNQGREVAEAVGVQAGYAEYFRVTPFDRIRIYSATAQNVKWVIREGSDVRYDRGASSVTGTVALDAATLAAIERPDQATGGFVLSAAIAANTPDTIFTAAANANGAIVLYAGFTVYGGANGPAAGFLHKATAPATEVDGLPVLISGMTDSTTGGAIISAAQLSIPQFIPAGQGLFFISSVAGTAGAGSYRACRYKLL